MSMRDLRYVVTLADELNFSRAAERCHVSQSTLSIQVRKLEEYLGVAIFERSQRHVRITEDGREIIELARVAVSALDRMIALRTRSYGRQ
jgi:LysR family hydrogen peroxide-inducible transcriptional activator